MCLCNCVVSTCMYMYMYIRTQSLNTLSLQLSGVKMVQEKLDDIRVSVSKSSPMIEIVNLVSESTIQFSTDTSTCICIVTCTCTCIYVQDGSIFDSLAVQILHV